MIRASDRTVTIVRGNVSMLAQANVIDGLRAWTREHSVRFDAQALFAAVLQWTTLRESTRISLDDAVLAYARIATSRGVTGLAEATATTRTVSADV